MHRATWLRLIVLVAAVLQVATVFLDYRLVPYCGTVGMAGLLAIALSSPAQANARRWTRHAALAGLTALTVAAVLADHRTGGFGWSTEAAGGTGFSIRFGLPGTAPLVVEAVLLIAGGAALAAAVLGRAEQLLRWRHLPGAVIGVCLVASATEDVKRPFLIFSDMVPPDPWLRIVVLMPAVLTVAALVLAANVALASRGTPRRAAAGLLALVALTFTGYDSLEKTEPMQPHVDPVVAQMRMEKTISALQLHLDDSDVYSAPDRVRAFSPTATSSGDSAAMEPDEAAENFYRTYEPQTPEDARRAALAVDVRRESGVVAVPYPPSWAGAGTDWARSRPAINATVIAVGLAALILSLFPSAEQSGPARSSAELRRRLGSRRPRRAATAAVGAARMMAVTADRADRRRCAIASHLSTLLPAPLRPSCITSPATPPSGRRLTVMAAIAGAVVLIMITAGLIRAVPGVPEPAGAAVPRGGKVLLRGDSRELMIVTLLTSEDDGQIADRPGHRLVMVTINVENTGSTGFRNDIEEHSWLVDRDGHTYGHNADLTRGKSPVVHDLGPGWSTSRYVVFEVPADADLTRFRLSLDPHSSKQTADWLLG